MSEIRDFTGKNRKFTGVEGERISTGTSGERVDTTGVLRFNSTTNLMEYYDGTSWKAIDAPPVVTGFTVDDVGGSSVTSATIDNEKTADSGVLTIEVLGSLFDTTGATVTFIATTGNAETLPTATITRNSANKLTVTIAANLFDVANSPYSIKVENGSGLSASLADAISADADAPTFTNAADTNADIFDSARGSVSIAAADLVGASGVVSSSSAYAVQSGSLPSGLSLNTTTGVISGSTSAVGSDTVSTFTIRATSAEGGTADRQFTITLKAPQITTYTSGSGQYAVPSGLTGVNVLVVAGGGGGGAHVGAGGGAGGLIYRPAFAVTPGGQVAYSVGGGGAGGDNPGTYPSAGFSVNGQASSFGTLSAQGGGRGASWDSMNAAANGGSGGGGNQSQGPGQGTQSQQSGDSGTYGFGNNGGSSDGVSYRAGGGGGAGGAGGNGAGPGGIGKAYSISGSSTYYAGGGGGGNHNADGVGSGGQGGGGQGSQQNPSRNAGQNGGANTGGGGGGGGRPGGSPNQGGNGGSGVVIISY